MLAYCQVTLLTRMVLLILRIHKQIIKLTPMFIQETVTLVVSEHVSKGIQADPITNTALIDPVILEF